jgi:hypothetical protein
MTDDKIVVYQSYLDPIKANIVKGLLDSYGIECFLTDENMVTLNLMYSQAVGGVKLNIFERDIQQIDAILQSQNIQDESETTSPKAGDKVFCPVCHSGNVSYGGSINRKFNYWHVFYSFILMLYPISMRKAYHCFDCDHEFKKA